MPHPSPASSRPQKPFHDELIGKLGHFLNYSDDDEDDNDDEENDDLHHDDDYDQSSDTASDGDLMEPNSSSTVRDLVLRDRSNLRHFQELSATDSNVAGKKQSVKTASELSCCKDPPQTNSLPPSLKDPFPNLSDFRSAVLSSASVTDAAIAFQKWRHFRLKMMFSEELKKALEAAQQDEARFVSLKEEIERKEQHVMHALAESSQLRARLSALENINKESQGSSEMEILQEDLAKALERAISAEDEVERYNREIRSLRERLKSAENEAHRLGSELKANSAFNQKEKSGVVEENRVLLDQLARKDEEVVAQTQEINNLKSMLAGMRVSHPDLGRSKNDLQHSSKRKILHANFEEKENKEHQISAEAGNRTSEAQCLPKIQPASENLSVFLQLVDLLQKLVVCLEKNEKYVDPCMKKVLPDENMLSSNLTTHHSDSAHGSKRKLQVNNRSVVQLSESSHGNENMNSFCMSDAKRKAFSSTCWKWRWAASACKVQALSKELNTLRSLGKEVFEKHPFISGPMKRNHEKSFENNVFLKDHQDPLPFEKVFSLLASIWQTSSRTAHLENELNKKKRNLDHFLHFMFRWIQRISRKRQLQKSIVRWLLYLLKSQRDKFYFQAAITKPCLSVVATATSKQRLSHLHTISNRCSKPMKNVAETPAQQAHTLERTLHILKVVFHHKLEELEDMILKEANSWYQKIFQERFHLKAKTSKASSSAAAAAGFVSKLCKELERCFSDACKETILFFDISNKDSCPPAESVEGKSCVKVFSQKPMVGQVKVQTIKKTMRGKV